MHKILLPLAAAAAIVSAASLMPDNAVAMPAGIGAAMAIQAAAAETSVVQDVAYVCRHRPYSSRRVCAFVRGGPVYRPFRGRWHHGRRW